MYLPLSHVGAVVLHPLVGAVVLLEFFAYSTSTSAMTASCVAIALPPTVDDAAILKTPLSKSQ